MLPEEDEKLLMVRVAREMDRYQSGSTSTAMRNMKRLARTLVRAMCGYDRGLQGAA